MVIRVTVDRTAYDESDLIRVTNTMRDDMYGRYVSENVFEIQAKYLTRLMQFRRDRDAKFEYEYL